MIGDALRKEELETEAELGGPGWEAGGATCAPGAAPPRDPRVGAPTAAARSWEGGTCLGAQQTADHPLSESISPSSSGVWKTKPGLPSDLWINLPTKRGLIPQPSHLPA